MFSVDNYNEAIDILTECEDIMEKTKKLNKRVPQKLKTAFYHLFYCPENDCSKYFKNSNLSCFK